MTSFLGHSGVCVDCDCFAHVWADGRCDPCHARHKVREDYADNLTFAQGIYGAATADDALRLLGVALDPKGDRP